MKVLKLFYNLGSPGWGKKFHYILFLQWTTQKKTFFKVSSGSYWNWNEWGHWINASFVLILSRQESTMVEVHKAVPSSRELAPTGIVGIVFSPAFSTLIYFISDQLPVSQCIFFLHYHSPFTLSVVFIFSSSVPLITFCGITAIAKKEFQSYILWICFKFS